MRKSIMLLVIVVLAGLFSSSCALPTPPPYPEYRYKGQSITRQQMITNVQNWSNDLEAFVYDWLNGVGPSAIPVSLYPNGWDPNMKHSAYVANPDTLTGADQFGMRVAQVIDPNKLKCNFPDPHCTYIVAAPFLAPFGHQAVLKGQFPRTRFFSVQWAQPFDPDFYCLGSAFGTPEIPIVDVDITPDPGHVNPFIVGANRNATNRNYTLTCDLRIGNLAVLNPGAGAPYWKKASNNRIGGTLQYQGPWGDPNYPQNSYPGFGEMDDGRIWIRYYQPDNYGAPGFDPLCGVPIPKLHFVTPDGRKYYIGCNFTGFNNQANIEKAMRVQDPAEPAADFVNYGFTKQFGIFQSIIEGMCWSLGGKNADWKYVRDLDKGVCGRGESQPIPGSWEAHASGSTHINYLLKHSAMSMGAGKVMTAVGVLPTFPNTKTGGVMTKGNMRYWSMTTYDGADGSTDYAGYAVSSVCDDELTLDASRWYIIVWSRAVDKPVNAVPSAGVTWRNFGTVQKQGITLRWLSVYPDHYFSKTPNEINLVWAKNCLSGTSHDPNIIGNNKHDGFLGTYKPIFKQIPKADFEKFGSTVTKDEVLNWTAACGSSLANAGKSGGYLVLLPLMLIVLANVVWFFRRRRS